MKTRPVVAAVFVVCCLLLCGLILRHQIAAHPLPPETAQTFDGNTGNGNAGAGGRRFWMGMDGWQPVSPALGALAHEAVAGQLSALKAGDGPKAWTYQSRGLRQNFSSPALLMQIISRRYPEFLHYRRVEYGPMMTDKSGQEVRALVRLEGESGDRIQAIYMLVREAGDFKVSGVQPLPEMDGHR